MTDSVRHEDVRETDIAILGMAGRFPKSPDLEAFWHNLEEGVECITFFSEEELRAAGMPEDWLQDPRFVPATGKLDDIELFDAALFGFTPREASVTDPQHRVFLECAWAALEDAGHAPGSSGEAVIGLFAGMRLSGYLLRLIADQRLVQALGDARLVHANDKDYLSTWTAYKLDLRGPCMAVQTACSTSLVAVHQACQALVSGECDMALAGGVAITDNQTTGYRHEEGDILSPDGHNRAYDARAGGTVGGNGAGVVVLKRLVDALADGDRVRAVIRGSAVNNDGAQKVGFTAPSIEGQAAVIEEALAVAGVEPETVELVEGHGTATALGDTVEVAALADVFGGSGGRRALGTVKSNLGHLEAAAGIAGLIKTVLALERRTIPPSLHFETPNPGLDLEAGSFYVPTHAQPWEAPAGPRRAGVSSFGIGGTNAHVVLEEAPRRRPGDPGRPWQVLPLAAQSEVALEALAERLGCHLGSHPELDLADVAHTLQLGRRHLPVRRAMVCRQREEAAAALEPWAETHPIVGDAGGGRRPVAFLFPGQGAQYPGMGGDVYRDEPVYREAVDRACQLLEPHLGLDLRSLLHPEPDALEEARRRLDRTELTQPALFVVEHALAQLWSSWGVEPEAMLGHSVGEYVAATLGGTFELDDALALVSVRGRLLQELPSGSMTAVEMSEKEILPLLGDELALAAVNAPRRCTVSGSTPAVGALEERLTNEDVAFRRLHTSHAFHSPMVEPALGALRNALRGIRLAEPERPWISNLSGTWIGREEATDPEYWVRHARNTVRFAEGLAEIAADGDRVLLEVGPGEGLSRLARRQAEGATTVASLPGPGEESEVSTRSVLRALGTLWVVGVDVDWRGVHRGERRCRVPLPIYPFQRQRYWLEQRPLGSMRRTVRRREVEEWLYVPVWKQAPRPAAEATATGGWLVFHDGSALGDELVTSLGKPENRIVQVRPGDSFERLGSAAYRFDPSRREDYRELFRALAQAGEAVDRLLFLATRDPGDLAPEEEESTSERPAVGFYPLLYALQELTDVGGDASLGVDVVVTGLHDIDGEEALRPEWAPLLGFCRTVELEYPGLSVRNVEVDSRDLVGGRRRRLLDNLRRELTSRSDQPLVAYRGPHRWVPELAPFPVPEPSPAEDRLREGGVYLITGGLGGMGLGLGRYLAEAHRARLVLVSRTPLPAEKEAKPDDPRPARVRELRRLGAEVLTLEADVTDRRAMAEVLERTRARFGRIDGVIHAAGAPPGGVLALKDESVAEPVLGPKIVGTRILDDLLGNEKLDFLVLCSSLTAIQGGAGQSDYVAANAYLDAFARNAARRADAPFTVSIGWCTWREAGMAADARFAGETEAERARRMASGLSNAEGAAVLRRALAAGRPHVLVSTVDPTFWQHAAEDREEAETRLPAARRPDLERPYVAPRNEVERTVAEIWQELLGIEGVGIHDDFFALGGDSLLGVRFVSRLHDRLDVDLPVRTLFENPTVEGVATAVFADDLEETDENELEALVAEIRGLATAEETGEAS